MRSRRLGKRLRAAGSYVVLSVIALIFLGPFIWMASGSLKTDAEFKSFPPTLFGRELRWENFAGVFQLQPFGLQYLNSVIVLVAVCALTVVISTAAGYAFAKVRMPGSGAIFIVLLSGIFIPIEATILPLFRLVSALGWLDSLVPLIIITATVSTAPIATFIMRQAFVALPAEFSEAARIDGAGRFRVFLQIYAPMARPSIAAAVVYTAWLSWNQFLEPLLFLRTEERLTVPVALTHFEDMAGPLYGIQAAAATLSVLPVIIVFLLAQKQVVAGLTEGGVK